MCTDGTSPDRQSIVTRHQLELLVPQHVQWYDNVAVHKQAMIGEHLAAVRCAALRSLGRVLEAVDSLPPSDAKIFNE